MSTPSRLLAFTHAARLFAVAVGSALLLVGTSVEPKAETTRLMPAAWYESKSAAWSAAAVSTQAIAWSAGPSSSQNESALSHTRSEAI